MRYANDRSEAKYLLNQSFLKVYTNLNKFDRQKEFRPWLRTIIINTCLSHIKQQQKFRSHVEIDHARELSSTEEILSKISYKELLEVIQSLSTVYRTVFNMYVMDGYKHEEIAKLLGIGVSTSKSNLSRARMKLREAITKKMNYCHE